MSNNSTYPSPNNFTILYNSLDDSGKEYNLARSYATFASYTIIVILSPVAVAGNALILAAIWKKTFQRTPFHILLSGLTFTDLCTGLISQPLMAAHYFLHFSIPRTLTARPVIFITITTMGNISAVYFVALTLLIEGGVRLCGNAVLRYFWRRLAEIFISTCGISVLLGYAVCGIKKVWVTVIGDRDVSAVLRFH